MQNTAKVGVGLAIAIFASMEAGAVTASFDSRADWKSAVTAWDDVKIPGKPVDITATPYGLLRPAGTALDLGFGYSLAFSEDTYVRKVGENWPADDWAGSNEPRVLYYGNTAYTSTPSITGTFTPGVYAFGFEVSAFPADDDPETQGRYTPKARIQLTLADGTTYTEDFRKENSKFFGFVASAPIASMEIEGIQNTYWGFAMGEMVVGKVPDAGATFGLLLCGLGTLGAMSVASRRK